jgi:hypothetical protein
MTFLYPSFLWALAILSIPILIHLFNFRRTVRVFFSNTRFLKQVKEVTTAKRRLKHYLILLSRLLFITFLVLAFAQPLIPAREQLGANKSIVLYIDNSQSMSAQMQDRVRGLDAALNFAREIVNVFPPDTRYRILTNDFAPFSNSSKTKPEALDVLAQVRLSPVSRSMGEIRDRLQQQNLRSSEVFWVSDFQRSTLGQIPPRWDTTTRWHLVPIRYAQTPNVFVDSVYLQNPFAAGGEKNVLTVKVRNEGKAEIDQLNLKLTINGIQAGTATADIPQGGFAETNFDLTTSLKGLNRATVSFSDFPVSFDNEFYVALNFTDKINIIEVKANTVTTSVEKVFGNRGIFNFRSFSVSNFNYSLVNGADLIIVNGINQIDASLQLSLRNYLSEQHGALLLIPGPAPDIIAYQQFTGNGLLKQLPEKPGMQELDKPDFSNPFFENVFEEQSISLAMPKAAPLLEWGNDRSAILRFKNDKPFLSRFDQGGKLYLMASPLQSDFTDFYNHALFVPVMYRIAASGKKDAPRLYYSLHESFINMRADSLVAEEQLRLIGKQEIVPSQRRINDRVLMDIPKFSIDQGFYNVVSNRDTINLIAFNLDKAESILDQYSANDLKLQMGNGSNITIFEAGSSETFSNEIKARYLGKPLWKYALMLALVFLLAEVLLVRFLK